MKRLSLLRLAFRRHLDIALRDLMVDALQAARAREQASGDDVTDTNLRLELLRTKPVPNLVRDPARIEQLHQALYRDQAQRVLSEQDRVDFDLVPTMGATTSNPVRDQRASRR